MINELRISPREWCKKQISRHVCDSVDFHDETGSFNVSGNE